MVMELVERNLVKAVGAGGSTDGAVDPFAAGFRRVHQVRVSICTQKRVRLLLLLIASLGMGCNGARIACGAFHK